MFLEQSLQGLRRLETMQSEEDEVKESTWAWLHMMKAISVSMEVGPRYTLLGRA